MKALPYMQAGADIDGLYRYRLWRRWAPMLEVCCFVMLNPSTADGTEDDRTIRRCIWFARAWGYGALEVVNVYALRSKDPQRLLEVEELVAVGPRNEVAIAEATLRSRFVVAAWGVHVPPERARWALDRAISPIRDVHHLGLTRGGAPRHPLYLPGSTVPTLWRAGRREP